jgi:3-hydroxyisobutyrate dehydrogenase-like beta-hydroxyacid dehydrogenase
MADLKVGLIGLGAMGRGMGKNLLANGFPLTVYDVAPPASESMAARGGTAAGSPAEVGEASDVVITVVPNSPDVEAVVLGPNGIVEGARPGTIIMDCSTIEPAATRRIGEQVRARGMSFVDAGMGRSSKDAEAGNILFMVGASDEDFARIKPVLQAMGKDIFHVGPPGAGITLKLVHNLLTLTILTASAEAIVLGAKAGLDVKKMVETFQTSTTGGFHMSNTIPDQVLKGAYEPGFKVALAHKDLGLGQQMAASLGVPLWTLAVSRELFTAAMARGRGDWANGAIATVIEELIGLKVADVVVEQGGS